MSLETDRVARVTALDLRARRAALAAWRALNLSDLQRSYVGDVLPVALRSLTEAQYDAADIGADYIDEAAKRDGVPPGPPVVRDAFTGVASDGRNLRSLLIQPLINAFTGLAAGFAPPVALASGANLLDEIFVTQIHDAARAAEETAIAANIKLAGYIRVVEPGACARCIVLAGRFYKWNEGFRRHERCRCTHRPSERSFEPQDSRELFNKLSPAEQDATFTKARAEAIRQGADVAQVVNSTRGMSTATVGGRTVKTTLEGTTKRGYAALVRGEIDAQRGVKTNFVKGPTRYTRLDRLRLQPGEIIRLSNGDRAEARRLLITNGYIVGDIKALASEAIALGK